jgi:hypothetical protein
MKVKVQKARIRANEFWILWLNAAPSDIAISLLLTNMALKRWIKPYIDNLMSAFYNNFHENK